MEEINSGSPLPRIFGGTPTTRAKLAGVEVKCLVHTSSMVILVSENFFEEKLKPICSRAQGKGKMFTLLGANSLEIPYLGYLELDVQVEGVIVPDCRVLVLKDTAATVQYRKRMPSVVRMNVLEKISTWAELLKMKRAAGTSWNRDHKSGEKWRLVKVAGNSAVWVPPHSASNIDVTGLAFGTSAVVEPLSTPLKEDSKS